MGEHSAERDFFELYQSIGSMIDRSGSADITPDQKLLSRTWDCVEMPLSPLF